MKKHLIALAALAATGAVMAQSSVTIYGVIDQGFTSVNNSGAGSTDVTGLTSSNMTTNRLGFRGTEDLGGGLKAKFQIETGFAADAPATTTMGDRGAWVGLEGGFGEVRLGREYSTTFWAPFMFSAFGTGGVGNYMQFGSRNVAHGFTGQSNAIWNNNSATYTSPRMAGFMAQVQYAFDEQTAAGNSVGQSAGIRVNYTQGPLAAEIGFSNTDGGTLGTALSPTGLIATLRTEAGLANTQALDHKSTVAGASYDFGVAKVMAHYGQEKASLTTGQELVKVSSYEIGVVAPMGPGRIRAAYGSSKVSITGDTDPAPKATKIAVGYIYDLSKRTALYATVAQMKNKNGLNLALNGPTSTNGTNGKSTGYNIGISHTF
ncbi:porin [Aquabacterium sp. A08]|uniref:porin n=1 Tax=Aquabacterium sp. A08 TaxID=2718532 RepID=UPI00141F1B16|nr:porin [Aquabacterium sp. A08]NIC42350.1 porin [Aquabacterium sp. A08]